MKKVIYFIIVLLLVGLAFYFWQNRHDYFFQGEDPYETYDDEKKVEEKKNENDKESDLDEKDQEINNEENNDNNNENVTGSNENQELLDILQNHCDNRCLEKKDTDYYDYCLEICGFNGKVSQYENCEELSDEFERNVCYKKQAIKEKNSGVCEEISDSLLKENCKDRVIEELFN